MARYIVSNGHGPGLELPFFACLFLRTKVCILYVFWVKKKTFCSLFTKCECFLQWDNNHVDESTENKFCFQTWFKEGNVMCIIWINEIRESYKGWLWTCKSLENIYTTAWIWSRCHSVKTDIYEAIKSCKRNKRLCDVLHLENNQQYLVLALGCIYCFPVTASPIMFYSLLTV